VSIVKDEKGHALLVALLALGVGALLVLPFMQSVQVNSIASRSYPGSLMGQAAADAGVEDAIWRLTNDDLAAQLGDPGDSVTYLLDYAVNGLVPEVSVTRDHGVIASDYLESGGWSGGTGWLQDWYHQGDAAVVGTGEPQEGYYHLMLNGDTDYVKRSVDLSSAHGHDVKLYFWAKAKSFQGGEQVQCLVSPNGSDWTPVKTWANGDDDNAYRFYDVDLSSYGLTSQFWIAFQAYMSGPNSYFYVDSITVVRPLAGTPLGPPSDDFESGDWSGGFHWLTPWEHYGNAVNTPRSPYEGKYHLEVTGPSGYVNRRADLSGFQTARLQFWAQGSHFDVDDHADCLVSPDGVTWYSLISWTVDDSDWEYHFVDVDLPQLVMTEEFWVAFEANMSSPSEFFDVDDLKINGSSIAYQIVSTAGNVVTTAHITVVDGTVSVLSWLAERQSQ